MKSRSMNKHMMVLLLLHKGATNSISLMRKTDGREDTVEIVAGDIGMECTSVWLNKQAHDCTSAAS